MSESTELSPALIRTCRAMQGLALFGAVVIVGVGLFGDGIGARIDAHWAALDEAIQKVTVYSSSKRAIVGGIGALSYFSPLLILFGVWRIFGRFARGPVLSQKSVRTVRLLGWLIMAQALASILTVTAMHLAMTYGNPPDTKVLTLQIGSHHIQQILFGALFVVVGYVLTRAAAAAEENEQFI